MVREYRGRVTGDAGVFVMVGVKGAEEAVIVGVSVGGRGRISGVGVGAAVEAVSVAIEAVWVGGDATGRHPPMISARHNSPRYRRKCRQSAR